MGYNYEGDYTWEDFLTNHSVNYFYPDDYEISRPEITRPSQTDQKVYLSLIFVAAIILNVIVVILQLRKPILQWKTDTYPIMLSHIAVVNLLVTIVLILTNIIHLVTMAWHGSNVGCKFLMFTFMVIMYMNMFSVLGLLLSSVAKLFTRNSERNVIISLLFILPSWTLSCILSSPQFFLYEKLYIHTLDGPLYICGGSIVEEIYKTLYHILSSLALYLVPFVVAVVLSVAYCLLRRKVSHSNGQPPDLPRSVESVELSSVECEDQHTDEQELLTTETLQPGHTAPYLPIIVNCIYFLMSTPYHICVMVHFFSRHYYSDTFVKAYMWSHYVALANVVFIPFAIILFN